MALEKFGFKDLFGSKINIDTLDYEDNMATIKLLRKIDRAEYTLLLVLPRQPNHSNTTKIQELCWMIKAEMNGLNLLIQTLEKYTLLISPFCLEDWQYKKIRSLIAARLGIDLKPLKIQK